MQSADWDNPKALAINISHLEKRSDLFLSTLRSYVGAMGGTLELVAVFLTGI
jgi:hypothetical protein